MTALPDPADVVEAALRIAGGPAAVIVSESSEAELRFANSSFTTNGVRHDRTVTVIGFLPAGDSMTAGIAAGSGEVDLAALVATAKAAAASTADDAFALIEGSTASDFGEPPGETDLGVLSDIASELGAAFDRATSGDRVLAGFAEHSRATTYLGLSTGLRRRHLQETSALHLVGRSADQRRSAWAASGESPTSGLVEALEEKVVRGLEWSERHLEIDPGRHEVLLPPDATADLMVAVTDALGGRDAEDGRTVFSKPGGGTRIGDRLADLPFRLFSDPGRRGLECDPFLVTAASSADTSVFDNGVDLEPVRWVDDGILTRLAYHRAGAERSGAQPTFPVDNLVLELPEATSDVESMIASTERGLLLTCLWYIREVDPATLLQTGLTRDGVYVIEDGKVVGATTNFRFNESPVDLLGRAIEASRSQRCLGREFGEWLNRTEMPALRIPDFHMSSVSPAS